MTGNNVPGGQSYPPSPRELGLRPLTVPSASCVTLDKSVTLALENDIRNSGMERAGHFSGLLASVLVNLASL